MRWPVTCWTRSHQCDPMSPTAELCAALLRLEAPREIGRFEQPVLEVSAVNEMHRPELAAGDHLARLLHQRIAAVVERHRVDDAGLVRRVEQPPGIGAVIASGLSEITCLPRRQRRQDHRHVQVVRRRVVHDVDVGIGDQRLVAAVRLRHAERVGLPARRRVAARRDRDHVDEAESAHGVDVVGADEARADQAHADACHQLVGLQASACFAYSKHFFTS